MQHGKIRTLRFNGTGNITGEFRLDGPFALRFCRTSFSGGTGSAELVISVAPGRPEDLSRTLIIVQNVGGAGDDVNSKVPDDQRDDYAITRSAFSIGDALGIAWTNPDPGVTKWDMELGLEPYG